MSTLAPTFDESWHRVSPRRIRLRPGVEIFPQRFRGQRWYVVRDSLSGKFFRIRPEAYQFICELERNETVGDAWERRLEIDPENVPGQGEVVRLLSSLHRAGLVRSDMEGDVEPLAEAFADEKLQAAKQRWLSILFFKLPLWNPDSFLRRTLPLAGWLFTKKGLFLWLALLLWAGSELVPQWQAFRVETSGILGVANLPWLYATMIVIKLMHEFGHGYACRKLGGEVPETGIMLLLFNPLPYVDASSSSAFRSKWDRILVGAAGMMVEFGVAAVAVIVWANTGQGLVHTLAHNAVVVASVVTLLFNGNPLLRYDGYQMLSDWLELPNLQSKASRMALYLLERFGFSLRTSVNPAESRREGWWLAVYFLTSVIYRTIIMVGILLVVSLHFLVFGMLLAVGFAFMWLVLPVFKAVGYLWNSPRIESCRTRAATVVVMLVVGILGFFCLVPMPNHFRAEAVLRAEPFARVYARTDGRLAKVLVPSGTMVKEGTPLLELVNEELTHEIDLLNAEQQRAEANARQALEEDPVRYQSLRPYFRALEVRRVRLNEDVESLTVCAPCDGRWLAPDAGLFVGATLPRGLEMGVVQGEGEFYISAVVKQEDVSRLFTSYQVSDTEVRVRGQEGAVLGVKNFKAIPAEREFLPSASLGLLGGGTAAVDSNTSADGRPLAGRGVVNAGEAQGTKTTEPVFEIRATLDSGEAADSRLLHGQRAMARMTLPPEPLMSQWVRSLRQLFQRTYKI
jgi:putative peptide zinc metalloprotease protein